MEIRKAEAVFSELATARESATIPFLLVQTSRQAEWDNFMQIKQDFKYALIKGYCHREAVSRLSRSGASCVTGTYVAFSGWS